jgi:hypothetical protein
MATTYAILGIVTAWQANEAGHALGRPGLTCQAAKIGLPVGSTGPIQAFPPHVNRTAIVGSFTSCGIAENTQTGL